LGAEQDLRLNANSHKVASPIIRARQFAQQAEQGSDFAQGPLSNPDLNSSVMTVTYKYRHDNQNSIYYLKPGSTDIFFLDFGRQSFLQEQLNWKRG